MKSDEQISREYKPVNIEHITNKLSIPEEAKYEYGKYIAKISDEVKGTKKGKIVLVTSTSPDVSGIGKTTVTIGLSDALNSSGYNSVACIREPSLGPVFGRKGGASGGGYSQGYPLEEINLEFTGDFSAVTNINNLICAVIDNEIFQGNSLNIDKETITFTRVIDVNDRSLRNIELSKNSVEFKREETFKLTSASEVMAVLCLSTNFDNFLENIENIAIAQTKDLKVLKVKDLGIIGAIAALAKKLIKPNIVQSLKANPLFIHGGPFANIAHGTNSLIATKMAQSLSDYVITEAGFGSDMGAEKFLNLVCQKGNIEPHAIVLVTTIKSLKEYSETGNLKEGVTTNLEKHIRHLKNYNSNLVVTLNKYEGDTEKDIQYLEDFCSKQGVAFCVNNYYFEKENTNNDFLSKIVTSFKNTEKFTPIYKLEDDLNKKIKNIIQKVYHAKSFEIAKEIEKQYEEILNNEEYKYYPICFAKNPNSFSGDINDKYKKEMGAIKITNILVMSGAKFILLYINDVLTLPGLGKQANVYKISYDPKTKNINGLD